MTSISRNEKDLLLARRAVLMKEMAAVGGSIEDIDANARNVKDAETKKRTLLEEALHKENHILKIDLLLGRAESRAAPDTATLKALIASKDLQAKVKAVFEAQSEFCVRPSCSECVTGCASDCISRCTSGCAFCTSAVTSGE